VHVVRTGAAFKEPRIASTRVSVHMLPVRSVDEWVGQVCCMLDTCGRRELATRLEAAMSNSSIVDSNWFRPKLGSRASMIPVWMRPKGSRLRYLDNPLWRQAILSRGAEFHGRMRSAMKRQITNLRALSRAH